jgi:hypothetical protein
MFHVDCIGGLSPAKKRPACTLADSAKSMIAGKRDRSASCSSSEGGIVKPSSIPRKTIGAAAFP